MSIIYGVLRESGDPITPSSLRSLGSVMERYATGAGSVHVQGRLAMGFHPYFSHLRSALEQGPTQGPHRDAVCFDGRLDNYQELSKDLRLEDRSDSEIVLASFAQWGEDCFSRLVGDWALALWSENDQCLYLARDHAGTRTLYFHHGEGEVTWATYLEAFQKKDMHWRLSHDYAACYLAGRFVYDLTPYEGVRAVPPAHYVKIRSGRVSLHRHWSPAVKAINLYDTDTDYEAGFLTLFHQSVARRTGPGAPILAQLSGGMDSTAIVCMSDEIRRSTHPKSELLDTVSFYDDAEASLNERPYFSITEARRGKVGTHLDMAFSQRTFAPYGGAEGTYLLPGADSFSIEQERRFRDGVWRKGYRSVLSGIGGDEVLGGIPDPLPELADYLASGKVRSLLRQSIAWSLVDRSPLLFTLGRTAGYAASLYLRSKPKGRDVPPWIVPSLRNRSREMGFSYGSFRSRLGTTPHALDNNHAWWSVMETLPHLFPQLLVRPEYRYPFLDKDLVNYLFNIPREQILRPGRRRSLMRRALAHIIPTEVLERRRKAYQLRAPLHALQQAHRGLEELFAHPMLADAGLVDRETLRRSLRRTAEGDPAHWQAMLRTIALELWLRSMVHGSQVHTGDAGLRLTA
jgi:asparagine synthase (glutamine-hydrolysing)